MNLKLSANVGGKLRIERGSSDPRFFGRFADVGFFQMEGVQNFMPFTQFFFLGVAMKLDQTENFE